MRIPILSRFDPTSVAIILISLFALSACGGGGGSSPSANRPTVAPPSTPPAAPVESGPPYANFTAQDQDPDDFASLVASAETEEYAGMGGLTLINASSAYARGATGEGVSVGVIDSGVYEEHYEFTAGSGDKISIAGSDYSDSTPRTDSKINHGTQVAAVIAANKNGDLGTGFKMHGVAYDADILTYEIPLGSSDGPYQPLDEDSVGFSDDNYFASRFTTMANQVDIVNMSFGFSGVVTSYSAPSVENAFSLLLDSLRQQNTPRSDRAIFVISTGNAWGDEDEFGVEVDATSPELFPGLPYLFPELQDHMLAVTAVDSSGEISFYANHCGVAAAFCLAAPGGGDANNDGNFDDDEVIWSAITPPEDAEEGRDYYGSAIGTSFAAPLVSGSLALLKQLFPTVGNHELVNRLLVSADKAGIYANSAIYGQGLLDLDAATRPVGGLNVATGASLDRGMQSAAQGNFTGGALGTSLAATLSGNHVALFDDLGFPFYQSATALVNSTATSALASGPALRHGSQQSINGTKISFGSAPDLWRQDARFNGNPNDRVQADYIALQFEDTQGVERFAGINANAGWFFGVYANSMVSPSSTDDDSSFAAPWLRFARQGWSSGGAIPLQGNRAKLRIGLFNGTGSWNKYQPVSEHQGNGALVEYAFATSRSSLSIQTGLVREEETFLGTEIGSALGSIEQSKTLFTGINGHLQLSAQWQGVVAFYSGTTDSGLTNMGQLQLPDQITSSSWAMGFKSHSLWRDNDQLSLYLAQPLRIEGGRGQLQLATGRTLDRQVIYENIAFDLKPQGREQQLEINYHRPWKLAGRKAWLGAAAEYRHQPNHSALNSSQFEMRLTISMPADL